MSADRALLDTNILIYALDPTSTFCPACDALLERAKTAGAGLCIAPQNFGHPHSRAVNGGKNAASHPIKSAVLSAGDCQREVPWLPQRRAEITILSQSVQEVSIDLVVRLVDTIGLEAERTPPSR